jgi:hypothetical protein
MKINDLICETYEFSGLRQGLLGTTRRHGRRSALFGPRLQKAMYYRPIHRYLRPFFGIIGTLRLVVDNDS